METVPLPLETLTPEFEVNFWNKQAKKEEQIISISLLSGNTSVQLLILLQFIVWWL